MESHFSIDRTFEENFNLIRDELLQIYPLFQQRRDFFNQQLESEPQGQYLRIMDTLAMEADLQNHHGDRLKCHIIYSNLRNKSRKEKKLKCDLGKIREGITFKCYKK